MGYRGFVALAAAVLLAGCAAFDHDNTPYVGFSPDEIPIMGGQAGPDTGYYAGTMTASTNSCQAVSDAVGTAIPITMDVLEKDTVVNVTFGDGATSGGILDGGQATFLVRAGNVKHVYTLTFKDGAASGSCDVVETDASGEFGAPCATYALELTKGEKPAAE